MANDNNATDGDASDQDRAFESLQREITVAAREQGGEVDDNFGLRYAMRRAAEANMPDDLIERARQQGAGEVAGPDYQDVTFEGYGPDGVAVLVESITDDPNRTSNRLETLFEAHGGNLGEDGCVGWQFARRGLVRVHAGHVDDDDAFMLQAIEMGAEEMKKPLFSRHDEGRVPTYRVYCDPNDVRRVDQAMEQAGYPVYTATTVYEAKQRVDLESDRARHFLSFFEKLTGHEDVQDAYANWSVS
jgi:YebC/PmpR family DNA-binding regulatory protein